MSNTKELATHTNYAISKFDPGSIRNLKVNLDVCDSVYGMLSSNLSQQSNFQLIIGGKCCMLPSIMSAFWHKFGAAQRVGLIYLDADLDLASPLNPRSTGIFAGMTATHLLGLPGHLN